MRTNLLRSRFVMGLLAAGLMTVSAWADPIHIGRDRPFGQGLPPVLDSFFDVFVDLDLPATGLHLGSAIGSVSSMPFNGQVTALSQIDGFNQIETEILAMDLVGSGFMLRESPTMISRGGGIVSGDRYIASFFDVFFELSLDGGQTWIESDGPFQMKRVPEAGSTVALLLLSLVALGLRRRSVSA